MPGQRMPFTTAVAPSEASGFDLLHRTFQANQYYVLDDRALSKNRALDWDSQSVSTTSTESQSLDDGSVTSGAPEDDGQSSAPLTEKPPSEHEKESMSKPPAAGLLSTPPHLTNAGFGLPPTPPTMANSDDVEPKSDSLATNGEFADAVRNALHSQKSRLSTPGHQLPTPDPSPPGTNENLNATPPGSARLHPFSASARHLREYPSSRTDSFHTAREDPNVSLLHLAPTPSPIAPPLSPGQWLNSRHGGPSPKLGLGLDSPRPKSPKPDRKDEAASDVTPTNSPRQQRKQIERSRSPYHLRHQRVDRDLDKHISYISDENTNDSNEPPASAEDLNNLIYKQIREDNVKRHSRTFQNGGAGSTVPVGIYFSNQAKKQPKLRHTKKTQSLRNASGSPTTSQGSPRSVQTRYKKAATPRSLEASPVVESNASARRSAQEREVDGGAASEMTKMTGAAMGSAPFQTKNHRRVEHQGSQHMLRRSQHEKRIENLAQHSPRQPSPLHAPERTLRHFSPDAKLENNTHVRRTSLETNSSSVLLSSPRRAQDPRFQHASTTPFSASQFSDRTEVEVCEAQGVTIFPHNNESLLVVQAGSRPTSNDKDASPTPIIYSSVRDRLPAEASWTRKAQDAAEMPILLPPNQATAARPSNPTLKQAANPTIEVDSPLTHPRAAPVPPAFRVIPPTPHEELDKQLDSAEMFDDSPLGKPNVPQRRESLSKRARRYSESFIVQPLFGRTLSQRKPKSAVDDLKTQRPTYLSPFWRPNNIWEGYDSEDDEFDDDELDGIPYGSLPRGGDTSDVAESPSKQRVMAFPRSMSVRMPGFRGSGGFLVGNSLGLDRHGTNKRRHYVQPKSSTGGLHTSGRGGYVGETSRTKSLKDRNSEEMLQRIAARKNIIRGFRRQMSRIRVRKEERYREKRRQALRGQIHHVT